MSTQNLSSHGSPKVAFVGAGPGDPGLFTVRGRDYLARADVIILDSLHSEDEIQPFAKVDATYIDGADSTAGKQMNAKSRAKLLTRTVAKHPEASLIVRLMDGDPSAFSGLSAEGLSCSQAGISFDIVPGVSTAWSVPTYAGVPLSGKGIGELHTINGSYSKVNWSHSVDDDVTVVVVGDATDLGRSLSGLLQAGRSPSTPVALTEHGTTVTQHTDVSTLEEAVELLSQAEHAEATVAVIGAQVLLRDELSWYESKPLFGWRVLVPRTKDQAGPMVDQIASYGATSSVVPTISVEPPRTPTQMDKAIRGLVTGRYEWVGFTSVNAVRAVREKFAELGLDARSFSGLKIAAVGGVTERALQEWGLIPDLVPESEQSARGLLETWPEFDEVFDPINRVLLPRADIATDTLAAGLKELGWEVDDVTAYRTVRAAPPAAPIREAIKAGDFDAVCFTSSSTVRNLVGIAGKPHHTTVVACIGPATAKTAEEHGLRVDVVAPEPTSATLVGALADYGLELAAAAKAEGEPLLRPSQRRSLRVRRAARERA